jgi:hypothetical protein
MQSPFELKSLISWLEKQPPEREYDYYDINGECPASCYTKSLGIGDGTSLSDNSLGRNLWLHLHAYYGAWVLSPTPWTYGAALSRARTLA